MLEPTRLARLFFVASLLGACSAGAQREFQAMKENAEGTHAQIKSCVETVYNSAEYEPLRAHLPMSGQDVTPEQKADPNLATNQEVNAILTTHPKMDACRMAALQQLVTTHPTIVPILADQYRKDGAVLVDLIHQKISWGEYTTRLASIGTESQTAIREEERRIAVTLAKENKEELAEQQAASVTFARAMNEQHALQARERMVPMGNRAFLAGCNQLGSPATCASQ